VFQLGGSFSKIQKAVCRLGGMRLIIFVVLRGDQMFQKAEVHIVFMRRAEGSKGGGKMTAVPAAAAMPWHFRAILSGEKE
jgi:hypothetical protein